MFRRSGWPPDECPISRPMTAEAPVIGNNLFFACIAAGLLATVPLAITLLREWYCKVSSHDPAARGREVH